MPKGVQRKAHRLVTVEVALDASQWRPEAAVNAAIAAGQVEKRRMEAQGDGPIILAGSFYDMNTWDLDADPESRYRCWRADICELLDDVMADALARVRIILLAEDLEAESKTK